MNWYTVNVVSAFLLPPLNFLLVGVGGVLALKSRPRLGRTLIVSAFGLLYILSTPYFSSKLLRLLESAPALTSFRHDAGAIVVIGAGTYFNAPEYGGDTVNQFALERLRYGARLHTRTGIPLLVSGGNPAGGEAEATLMKKVLEEDFKTGVKWVEPYSNNTNENAKFSYRMLKAAGVTRIYLVTQAWHMPRAAAAFRQAGFYVIPAPTGFTTTRTTSAMSFLPGAKGLLNSSLAMHEWLGMAWYRLSRAI